MPLVSLFMHATTVVGFQQTVDRAGRRPLAKLDGSPVAYQASLGDSEQIEEKDLVALHLGVRVEVLSPTIVGNFAPG